MAKSPLIRSFGYAFKGMRAAVNERNFRLHLISTALTLLAAFLFQVSLMEWCVLLICIGAVLSLELINTALEHLVNLVSPDYHPVAGKVKDISAAAVLCFSIISFVIALIIFVPRAYVMFLA